MGIGFIAIVGMTLADPSAGTDGRVVFKRGAVEAEARGNLTTIKDELRFVVRARSGQHMRLWVDADGPTRGLVTFPDGSQFGEPGANFFDELLTADGDFRIRIVESPMAEEWKGSVTLHVRIE